MPLIETTEFPAIRAAIDISLSAGNLPDSIIALSIYQGAAERWVLDRDPNAATYAPTGTAPDAAKWQRVQIATIYKTASLICPAVPNITRDEFGPDESYTREAMDYAARASELADLAAAELSAYLESEPVTSAIPPFFTLACGRRGA